MQHVVLDIRALLGDRKAVTSLECGLVAAFVSVSLIAVIPGLATSLSTLASRILATLG